MTKWDESKHPRAKDGEFGHGGGKAWVGKLDEKISKDMGEKPKTPRKPRQKAAPKDKSNSLEERLKSGEVSAKRLSGGSQANVELVKLGDGSQIVRKTTKRKNQARQLDAEVLSAKYAEKLGITAPAVHRDSPTSVVMEHMDGKYIRDHFYKGKSDEEGKAGSDALKSSPEGRKLGLFDLVISNTDRNNGNYLISPDGKLQAIDHGMAFQEPGYLTDSSLFSGMNPFINVIADVVPGPDSWTYNGGTQPKSDKYSKADIAFMQKQLASLETDFERLGHMDWYTAAQDRIAKLAPLANGKGKLF